ncbi:MAG: hypothetical protein WBG92_22055 [Thiohalocapsa sp.]
MVALAAIAMELALCMCMCIRFGICDRIKRMPGEGPSRAVADKRENEKR